MIQRTSQQPPVGAARPVAGKKVLVVDDSPPIRKLLRLCLTGAGYHVVEAEDGKAGISQARVTPFNLVIADVNMPIMNGLDMIRHLRGTDRYAHTPMFVLTTESGVRVAEGKAAGATAWIVKPFRPDSLLAAVKKVLG